jgi:hypothetical protein
MASVTPVPTLSTFGWVQNPSEKIDFLLVHFFYADKSQTSIYGKNVSSLPWLIEQNTQSMVDTANAIRTALNSYLGRYYETVSTQVSFRDENPEQSSSKVFFSLYISVTENGVEYSAEKLVTVIDGRFKEFTNINNTPA